MRALVIDDDARRRADQVIAFAKLHQLTMTDIVRRMGKPGEAPGDDEKRVLKMHDGFRVVYSIEQQPEPLGWCHHISVSVPQRGQTVRWPHEKAISVGILPLFGLDMKNVAKIYTEPEFFAVNMLFKL